MSVTTGRDGRRPSRRDGRRPSPLTARLDAALGRVTMYRLVLLVLTALAVVAVVLAAVGELAYPVSALLVCLAVALGSAVAGTWAGARVVRVRPHLESSLITGLLVFFLLWPGTDGAELLGVALTGVLAGASKFALAWRGRHLANPAAVGAVLVAWLTAATPLPDAAVVWWVAAEPMLPVILIGGALVVFRVRRAEVALLFAVPALALTVVRYVDLGMGVGESLRTAVGSTPVLFLAAFMLTEPLTQAPRRAQRALVSVLVALLYVSPLYLTSFYEGVNDAIGVTMTPELALVLGNLVAFAFGQRRGIALTLTGRREVGRGVHELTFAARRPVRARAGQFVELSLPHRRAAVGSGTRRGPALPDARGSRRVFSLVDCTDPRTVTVATRVPAAGEGRGPSSFKRALLDLPLGARVYATGVAGDFVLPRRGAPRRKLALVAGGIGITPFVAHVREVVAHGGSGGPAPDDVVVVYAAPSAADFAYLETLGAVRGVLVSPDEPPTVPAGWRWVPGAMLTDEVLAEALPDAAERVAYISGPPVMVAAVRAALRRTGSRKVLMDAFTGY